jgi:D-alanine-D-alanine ligase
LEAAGHDVTRIAASSNLEWFDRVRTAEVVFNLCEGVGGVSRMEYAVASALELTGTPYTGCSAWTMTVCHRKPLLNAALRDAGLPIPPFFTPDGRRALPGEWPLPSIVKPAAEDASIGIEQGSVVTTPAELRERIAHVEHHHGSAFVQRYVEGREIAVAFVGGHTLPLSEIDFSRMPAGAWPIVSFSAKWHEDTPDYIGTEPVCPAKIDAALASRITKVAADAWHAVEGRGYGRVDLRVDDDGRPWILEVNPNPDLSTDAGLARMAHAFGWSYDELVCQILNAALEASPAVSPRAEATIA